LYIGSIKAKEKMCKTAEKLAATTFTTVAVILNIHFSTFCTLFYDMINKISNKYVRLTIVLIKTIALTTNNLGIKVF